MGKIQKEGIKEIARAIALGNICYIHRYTAKITTIDHTIVGPELIAAQELTMAQLMKKIDDYVKIEPPSTAEQLVFMRLFIKELSDKSIQKEISNALNRKNPMRNFAQVIDSDIALKIQWDNFNFESYQGWVSKCIIDAYNY